MKAVCIIGMSNSMFNQSRQTLVNVNQTLNELGLEVTEMKILDCYLPYYEEGMTSESFTKIANTIRNVKNLIFAFSVTDYSPCAIMKVFLEYFSNNENKKLLENKNVFIVSVSKTTGEKEAADYVSRIVGQCGGYEIARIAIGGNTFDSINRGDFPMDSIEKYAEDFYRLSKQNRVFIQSSEYAEKRMPTDEPNKILPKDYDVLRNQVETSMKNTMQNAIPESYLSQPPAAPPQKPVAKAELDFDIFNQRQEEDIEELTKLFANKLRSDDKDTTSYNSAPARPSPAPSPLPATAPAPQMGSVNRQIYEGNSYQTHVPQPQPQPQPQQQYASLLAPPRMPPQQQPAPPIQQPQQPQMYSPQMPQSFQENGFMQNPPVVPRAKSCKQMTQSLPHYFQAQLAQDTEAVFQINIFGDEEFSGYLVINKRDNEYYEGQYETPDITIIANSAIWAEILKGKSSAQKAFMTGQLKVRGNFMLLNRFDQIYRKM